MSICTEQSAFLQIENYFRKIEKISREQIACLIKLAQRYGRNKGHHKFINQIFSTFKSKITKQCLSATCKRFLILIDQILQLASRQKIFYPYAQQISKNIVDCYIFIFNLIFQYQLLDSSLDWKVYRMLWAKMISDQSFDILRVQIARRFRNFDLNKGFTQENIDRIKKRYNKKRFSQVQVSRYLDSNRLQITKKTTNINLSQTHLNQHNLYKDKQIVHPLMNPMSNMSLRQQNPSLLLANNNKRLDEINKAYKLKQQMMNLPSNNKLVYPKIPPVIMPNNNQPMINLNKIVVPQNNFKNKDDSYPHRIAELNNKSNINTKSFGNYNTLSLSQDNNPVLIEKKIIKQRQKIQKNQNQMKNVRSLIQKNNYKTQEDFIYQKIRQNLKKDSFQCRQCGLLLISKDSLQSHQINHFNQASLQFLRKQSDNCNTTSHKSGENSKNYDKFFTSQKWVYEDKFQQKTDSSYLVQILLQRYASQSRLRKVKIKIQTFTATFAVKFYRYFGANNFKTGLLKIRSN